MDKAHLTCEVIPILNQGELELNKIYCMDCFEGLKRLPDKSVHCTVTSPPYWNLRDYQVKGQIGLEPTIDKFIKNLLNVSDQVKRVLRDDGTCWVNLGDTYASSGGAGVGRSAKVRHTKSGCQMRGRTTEMPQKSLCMIPFRFAIEMVNRGWILRNTLIWHKPNCMPSSTKDRFTVDFEYIFFFTKSQKYYFEQQFESHKWCHVGSYRKGDNSKNGGSISKPIKGKGNSTGSFRVFGENGRNKRSVWTISTKGYPEAHFATYPENLIEIPIKAGCPENGLLCRSSVPAPYQAGAFP
ncbi:MAG: site-specific DNA-methyltransferase, partial [Deltaproteobacteria bacterium]|nr:site-specific DNA-methyltransferase [Deltaproteobacteria bacterium]